MKMADVVAQMPGTIIQILVTVGEEVVEDQEVMILESMKMENPVYALCNGTVKEIKIKTGDKVTTDQVLMIIE
jgi:acetyl-CoA carboxylase biotin carboxyl carrier protein